MQSLSKTRAIRKSGVDASSRTIPDGRALFARAAMLDAFKRPPAPDDFRDRTPAELAALRAARWTG